MQDNENMVDHVVTQEDLDLNPSWAENGVEVGHTISYKADATDEEIAEAVKLASENKKEEEEGE